jgi:hypothetical protein
VIEDISLLQQGQQRVHLILLDVLQYFVFFHHEDELLTLQSTAQTQQ